MSDVIFPLAEPLPDDLDAVAAFQQLSHLPKCLFLDSSLQYASLGRYSFIAVDPYQWTTVAAKGDSEAALWAIRKEMDRMTTPLRADLPPFQGGVAGLFGYELAHTFERLPRPTWDEFEVPALAVGYYDVVVAFDHELHQGWIVSQGFPEVEPAAREECARARIAHIKEQLASRPPARLTANVQPCELRAPTNSFRKRGRIVSNFSELEYLTAVERTIEYIRSGDIFQANLSQRLLHPAVEPSEQFYLKLRAETPSTFGGYLDASEFQLMSVSPERFFQVSDRNVEARPIKGTRPVAATPLADMFSGRALQSSEKDRAENVMIVDLLRNDISRSCEPASVEVPVLCGLESYGYVQHLVSVVHGRLRQNMSALDLLEHAFPGGSVTGAPKIRAMEIITELEQVPRGAYCGSLGYLSASGDCDLNILIRTITAKDGWWQMPVGGGITADSKPALEYAETWHKAAGLLRAL